MGDRSDTVGGEGDRGANGVSSADTGSSGEKGAEATDQSDSASEAAHNDFWAEAVADEIEAHSPDSPIIIKGGVSPSGVAHLGNVNEIMRG